MITVSRYEPSQEQEWNAFVDQSKNGTFLFKRAYMDYHAHRIQDHSLIARRGDSIIALLPANIVEETLLSHGGLTYGGFVTSNRMSTLAMLNVFRSVTTTLLDLGVTRLVYKTVPKIYHRMPADEDLYALFRHGARLYRRDVLSVTAASGARQIQARRRRGIKTARQAGIDITEARDPSDFWPVLEARLRTAYGVEPTHSLEEFTQLMKLFPQNIRLFQGHLDNEVVGGLVVYDSLMVTHVQYGAACAKGMEFGVLDLLYSYLIEEIFSDRPYFDFGISTEAEGQKLNIGLIEFKEGFGARAVAHDFYELELK